MRAVPVRTGRPPDSRIDLHVDRCIPVFKPNEAGGSANAATNREEKVRAPTISFATLSSIPSARTSLNSSEAQRAMAGVSVDLRGLNPKKGALGNSCASAAIFHVSSED